MDSESLNKALRDAAQHGRLADIQSLLERQADIEGTDGGGWTALILASVGGHYDIVALLLERNANVNAVTNSNWTPLHSAASRSNYACVELLLEHGADTTICNVRTLVIVAFPIERTLDHTH